MASLIYDEAQVIEFYKEILGKPKMDPFDADFFCVAARKKYMTQEEKEKTRLGDTTLLEKTPLREYNEEIFLHKLQKVDSCLDYLYSHSGANIPRSCMVFYMNVNHTNMINALKNLKIDIATMEGELYDVFMKKGSQENIGNKLKRLDNLTLKAYQDPKNVSKRFWIDIDMDISTDLISGDEVKKALDEGLAKKEVPDFKIRYPYSIIQTRGGYHILVNTDMISLHNNAWADYVKTHNGHNFKERIRSIKDFLDALENLVKSKGLEAKEIKINQNAMVPIPGTLQGGFEVKML